MKISEQSSVLEQNLVQWNNFINQIAVTIGQFEENMDAVQTQIDELNCNKEALAYKIDHNSSTYIHASETSLILQTDSENEYTAGVNIYSNCTSTNNKFKFAISPAISGLYIDDKDASTFEYNGDLNAGHRFIFKTKNAEKKTAKVTVTFNNGSTPKAEFNINIVPKKVNIVAASSVANYAKIAGTFSQQLSNISAASKVQTTQQLSESIAEFNKILQNLQK